MSLVRSLESVLIWTFIIVCFLLCRRGYVCQARAVGDSDSFPESQIYSDDGIWELVHVDFKTRLRHTRDVRKMDYHIIHIQFNSSEKSTIELHVTRKALTSSDFKVVIRRGNSELEEWNNVKVDCLYSGIVASEAQGTVALSTCGHPVGFSGMIMKSDGHWMIEPHPVYAHDFERTIGVPHRIRRSMPNHSTSGNLASDVLHVPMEDLEAGVVLGKSDSKTTKKDHPHSTEVADVMNVSTRTVIPLAQLLEGTMEVDDFIEFEPLAKKKEKEKLTKSDTTEYIIVELAVFADPYFYDEMKIRYPKDTDAKVKDYCLTVVHAMDLLYEQKSLGKDLKFKLVYLNIMESWPKNLKKNDKNSIDYLKSFCDYSGEMNSKGRWDHGLLLTGSNLKDGDDSSTAGLAWGGAMCYQYYSCSVSEALQLGVVYVIAHELGHSMGMDHDGSGTCKSCESHKFIMSPTTGAGKVTWSTCSSKNLADFIKYGPPDMKKSKNAPLPKCLTESHPETKEIIYKDASWPGQKYDAKKQCQLSFGKKYTTHITNKSPFNNICNMLFCANVTHATSCHAALEGTECATGKMCRIGSCVKST